MILVFGSSGQVATELRSLGLDAVFLDRGQADLRDPAGCAAMIQHHAAAHTTITGVINAAAYTQVDHAEQDAETADLVNAQAPTAMAQACATLGLPFVHISTDYVFDGTGTDPFLPSDATGPLGVYGASKRKGEDGIVAAGGTFGILRCSWVFSAHGANFVKTMLRLSETRDSLSIVADQIGGPTPASAIAKACVTVLDRLKHAPDLSGTYHYTGAPDVSWADFARKIFDLAQRHVSVTDITTADYTTPAKRPLNSRLDCRTTKQAFGLDRPNWDQALAQVIADLSPDTDHSHSHGQNHSLKGAS